MQEIFQWNKTKR